MATDLGLLAGASIVYLVVLFGIAELTERGRVSPALARHPIVFALSLGVYATSWSLYGSVGFADRRGYDFLAIYLGPTLSCLLIPVVWLRILRLSKTLQLSSLADLIAYRFQSQAAGVVVTVFMVLGSLPYFALQVRAVAEAATFFVPGASPSLVGFAFSLVVLGFTILFGTRHHRIRQARPGLVLAIAFESVIKLGALLLVAAMSYFGVLGGSEGVATWIAAHPEALAALHAPVREMTWVTLLLLSASAAFLLPRQFHMAFAERPSERALLQATWLFPLFLLVLNIAIVPTLWAGRSVAPDVPPDLYVLAVAQAHPVAAVIAFIGGFSAASAMVIVGSLALAGMMLNHLVTPYWHPRGDVYGHLARVRRVLVAGAIMAGWLAYVVLEPSGGLVQLGLVSFVAVAQFLPALFGILFWRRATREGLLAGLAGGIVVWFVLLVLPGLGYAGPLETLLDLAAQIDPAGRDRWLVSTSATLLVNSALFATVSLATRARPEEREAAAVCAADPFASAPFSRFESVAQVESHMARTLGESLARAEIEQACRELKVPEDETRLEVLQSLAERIERNLSGLIGPLPARAVLRESLQMEGTRTVLAEQVRLMEMQLEELKLDGTAAQVDAARRYLRGVLEELPMGICTVDGDGHVALWNARMAEISGLSSDAVTGRPIARLPAPWGPQMTDAVIGHLEALGEHELEVDGQKRIVRLDRTDLSQAEESEGTVLLVEDLTERRGLETQVAHQDRLASIGRLGAGVAHEIGNPLTGIIMVATNLQREAEDEDLQERLGLMISEAQRIRDIVQNLVDFSRGGASEAPMGLEPKPVSVAPLASHALELLRLSRRHREIECRVEVPDDLRVLADGPRLLQVFLNLLANACDASEAGRVVRIQGRHPQIPADDGLATIDIVDEGAGIPPDALPHIFDPFYTSKAVGEGTGLGLAVVFSIVRAHGGRIEVDSEVGRGTRMQVYLPVAPDAEAS